jgi:nudix-type nucleoside diphosphatase (YffH/AdpP family)
MTKKPKIELTKTEILSDSWYTYKRIHFDLESRPGFWESQKREVLDRGDGATILLYNKTTQKIILTKQFRLPTYLNKNTDGYLIESCAGALEKDEDPEANVRRESVEETGFRPLHVRKIFEAYMSPGAVTELITFFVAEYDSSMKVGEGGGLAHEHENIQVLEFDWSIALKMMNNGDIKDAKTIMLLQYAQIHSLLG